MRVSESSKVPGDFHCKTCGADYQSTTFDNERGDGMIEVRLDKEHRCPLYYGRFTIQETQQYEWIEGELWYRTVVVRITDQGHPAGILHETIWQKSKGKTLFTREHREIKV